MMSRSVMQKSHVEGAPSPLPFPFRSPLPLLSLSCSLPSLPLPSLLSPFLPFLPSLSLPLDVGPLIAARGPGERFSSPRGSGRSRTAKRYLAKLRKTISLLVATIFRSFSGNETSKNGETRWLSGTVVTYFTFMPDCQRTFQFKLRT